MSRVVSSQAAPIRTTFSGNQVNWKVPIKPRRRVRLSHLPDELLCEVLDNLDIVSKFRLRRVSRKWNSILREGAMLETVKLEGRQYPGLVSCNTSYLFRKRVRVPRYPWLWEHVRHLVLCGGYDLDKKEPEPRGWDPRFLGFQFVKLMEFIAYCKRASSTSFQKLQTILVDRVRVDMKSINDVREERNERDDDDEMDGSLDQIDCSNIRLTITRGSIELPAFRDNRHYIKLEFDIHDSLTFDLSGKYFTLPNKRGPKAGGAWIHEWPHPCLSGTPIEIAEHIMNHCDSLPSETVAQLGDVYSVLLQGQEGMAILYDVKSLFDEVFPLRTGDCPHRVKCRHYDFARISPLLKYAFVYFSRPQTCYRELWMKVKAKWMTKTKDMAEFGRTASGPSSKYEYFEI